MPLPTRVGVGGAIGAARRAAGLQQAGLADSLPTITVHRLRDLEQNKGVLTAGEAHELCRALPGLSLEQVCQLAWNRRELKV